MNKFLQLLKENKLLASLFILTLIFQLVFVFQTSAFSSDESYFHLRASTSIHSLYTPYYDDLSYGGRQVIYPPLFHILLFLFSFIPFAFNIIPALFTSSIIIIAYLIAKEITSDKTSSLLAASLTAFIPILISITINQISVYSLLFPMMFFMIYCLLKLEHSKNYLAAFIVCSFLLPLIHLHSLFFVLILIFYYLLLSVENITTSKLKQEAILFSSFIIILINFIIFKKAFLLYGLDIIWQNAPSEVIAASFTDIGILQLFYTIGIIPLLLGALAIFYGIFKEKRDPIFLLSALFLATSLLLIAKLVELPVGLSLLGIGLAIVSSLTFAKFLKYVSITKLASSKKLIISLILIAIVSLSVVPSLFIAGSTIKNSFDDKDLTLLANVKDAVPQSSTILSPPKEGNILTALTDRKNVIDSNFMLAPNAQQRLRDVNLMYNTWSEINALGLLHQYNISYIYISPNLAKENLTIPSYLTNEKCFMRKNEYLYQITC